MKLSVSSVMKGFAPAFLFLILIACSEDEKEPSTGVLNTSVALSSTAAMQGRLVINEAVMNISRIELNALSLSKNSVQASADIPENDRMFVLMGRSNPPTVTFDAQTTEYDPLYMTITTAVDPHELIVSEVDGVKTVDYNEWKINARPALLLTASFENGGTSTPVVIAINQILPLEVTATQNGEPVVEVGLENLAEITLNPAVWFEEITPQMLAEADKVSVGMQEIIFIHPEFNTDLHEKILFAIETPEKSMRLNITITKSTD